MLWLLRMKYSNAGPQEDALNKEYCLLFQEPWLPNKNLAQSVLHE